MKLDLDKIRTDGGTQTREELNSDTIAEYAELMEAGTKFPPVVAFHDGATYWLADGFHRYFAARRKGDGSIDCEVQKGTQRDAVLYSVGANAEHGLPRTNADKRKAVTMMLEDEEWKTWADREIARRCHVDHVTVGRLRKELSGEVHQMRTCQRGPNTYEIDTSNIGKSRTEVVNTKTGEVMDAEDVRVIRETEPRIEKIIRKSTDDDGRAGTHIVLSLPQDPAEAADLIISKCDARFLFVFARSILRKIKSL